MMRDYIVPFGTMLITGLLFKGGLVLAFQLLR